MEYSIKYLKKRIEEHPEEIKNMIRTQLNKCEDSIDPTGYLDYLELASIALSKDGLLLEQIESEIANKDYVRLAGIAIINNPEVYSKVKKSKIDLVLDDGGVEIDPFSSLDLGEVGEDNSKEIPDYDELEYYLKVSKEPCYIKDLPTELHHYTDIIMAAVQKDAFFIKYVPQNIENYRLIAIGALKKIGGVSEDTTDEREIVLAAVEKNSLYLRFVPEELIDNEIAKKAVNNDEDAILLVPTTLEEYKEMAFSAIRRDNILMKYISAIYNDYKEIERRFIEYITIRDKAKGIQISDDYIIATLVKACFYDKSKAEEAVKDYHEYLENNHEKTM